MMLAIFQGKSEFAPRDDIIKGILSEFDPGNRWLGRTCKGRFMVSKGLAQ